MPPSVKNLTALYTHGWQTSSQMLRETSIRTQPDLHQRNTQAYQQPKDAGEGKADCIVLGRSPVHQVVLPKQQPDLIPIVL